VNGKLDTRNVNTLTHAEAQALYWDCVHAHSYIRTLEHGHAERHAAFLPVIRASRTAFRIITVARLREAAQAPHPDAGECTTDRYTQLGLFEAQEARTG